MDALEEWLETASVQELATVHYFFRSVERSMAGGRSPRAVTLDEVMQLVLERFARKRSREQSGTGPVAAER
jgi:hypothetical protein